MPPIGHFYYRAFVPPIGHFYYRPTLLMPIALAGNSFSSDFRSLHDKLRRCPGLVKNAFSIDLYRPWGFTAFSSVARAWLEDHKSPVSRQQTNIHGGLDVCSKDLLMAILTFVAKTYQWSVAKDMSVVLLTSVAKTYQWLC